MTQWAKDEPSERTLRITYVEIWEYGYRIIDNDAPASENPSYEISAMKLVICVNYSFRNM
jgi:hypothetical protein